MPTAAHPSPCRPPDHGVKRGCFITLEGIDGAGKSTHAVWMVAELRARGLDVMHTREPGGTPLGERLREILLQHPMHTDTELLLMFAARNEHIKTVIMPHLQQGGWVVCDRFTDATYAYQGGGRGIADMRIHTLEHWVHPTLQPDCTFLLDLDLNTARQRLLEQGEPDRFEVEQQAFFERTRQAYLERAKQCALRFHVLDASLEPSVLQAESSKRIDSLVHTWMQQGGSAP